MLYSHVLTVDNGKFLDKKQSKLKSFVTLDLPPIEESNLPVSKVWLLICHFHASGLHLALLK